MQINPLLPRLRKKDRLAVGAIADHEALQLGAAEIEASCDVVELRLDSLGWGDEVVTFAKSCSVPLLVTARGPVEGGAKKLTVPERMEAYQTLLPYSAAIDIELRDFDPLAETVAEAKRRGVLVVGSFHNFQTTPPSEVLRTKDDARADVVKVACVAEDLDQVSRLAAFASSLSCGSVMGMGPLGSAARPLFAAAGSLLNYGFLGGVPTAPGQWPTQLLRQAIAATASGNQA